MRHLFFWVLLVCAGLISCEQQTKENNGLVFEIDIPESLAKEVKDGRIMLMLSTNDEAEPRFQIKDGPDTQLLFGMDVEDFDALSGKITVTGSGVFGYPFEKLSDIPPGEYFIQALFHKYETFKRGDGHIVKLPMDRGEGQKWNRAPGNLYSTPVKVIIGGTDPVQITLDNKIPLIEEPEDTEYIKHVKIKSELLTKFWGRPMYLGAHVLLPKDFDKYPDVKYPLAIMHGHFPYDFGGFRTIPPDPNLEPDYSERFQVSGYNRIVQQEAYNFYKVWTGPDFPRVLAIKIQHANPYYDDSYAVNSENLGPYGDAITYELIPFIEEQFRGIGEGWARFTYGGSTGGWEALAAQVKYPTEYNGCYAACPDPIDFRAYCLVNIYDDKNAYYLESDFKNTLRPGHRDYLGNVSATLMEMNHRELALGTKSRSGQQWDIWEAVYSPVGKDGYPKRIWDKKTGEIDSEVADFWKENYDLTYILQRDWEKHGNDWKGKIHIYCGDMDNYYLNNAVYLAEEVLNSLDQPAYVGEVTYGDRAEHCWNGDPDQPNHISRLRYHRMFIPKWAEEVKSRSPEGADLTSWRY
ncbi:MAG: hypothetical protein DWQ02_17215 [Bacteroidetes bacterium]|nr:MAG: hypothetical protein DWQ02_17215 [Bacteroidota bacterium]